MRRLAERRERAAVRETADAAGRPPAAPVERAAPAAARARARREAPLPAKREALETAGAPGPARREAPAPAWPETAGWAARAAVEPAGSEPVLRRTALRAATAGCASPGTA